jgi:hypothetical protein
MKCQPALATATVLMLLWAGCSTTPDEPPPAPVYFVPLVPEMASVHARLIDGRYPMLFEPSSTAVWVDAPLPPPPPPPEGQDVPASAANEITPVDPPIEIHPMTEPPYTSEAIALRENFLVLECRLASAFADQSIAYDAVGLRGIQVSLQLPDGREVPPAQTIIGGELLEAQRGALKVYGRTNLILFPKTLAPQVAMGSGAPPAMRLVLQGHESTFAFTWAADLSFVQEPSGVAWRQRKQETERRFSNTREHVQNFLHNFD